jgi:DNA-binding transcriptional LysR family regulator
VRPTEAGAAILSRAHSFVQEAASCGRWQRRAGEIRICAVSTALTGLLPAVPDVRPKASGITRM